MKTEIRTVMVPKEKAFWVADDGTTFEKESDCVDYELEAYRKQLGNSKDVIECKEARDRSPFDGGEYPEGNNYRWFKPLNESGVELLNKAFPSSYAKLGDDSIDNWHCVEYTMTMSAGGANCRAVKGTRTSCLSFSNPNSTTEAAMSPNCVPTATRKSKCGGT